MSEFAATIGPWIAMIAFLIGIANTVHYWLTKPGKESAARDEKIANDLKAHDRRIQHLESTAEHLPTKEGQHDLSVRLAKVETELEAVTHIARRIDDYMRSNNK